LTFFLRREHNIKTLGFPLYIISKFKLSVKERIMSAKTASAKSGKFELEVLNPRGKIEAVPASSPSPRLAALDSKTIGLYSNSKPGMDNFYTVFEELLKKKYPTIKVKTMRGAFLIRDDDAREMAREVDAFVYGVGD
jgi:hypothetical protein